MNTKKITEVPLLEQATETTHLLAEQDGTAVRIPAGAVGGGGGNGGAGAANADWGENDATNPAYVKNRTHWVEKSVEHRCTFNPATVETGDLECLRGTSGAEYLIVIDGEEYSAFLEYEEDEENQCSTYSLTVDNVIRISYTGAFYTHECNTYGNTYNEVVVSEVVATYHRLDKNYLPEDTVTKGFLTSLIGSNPAKKISFRSRCELYISEGTPFLVTCFADPDGVGIYSLAMYLVCKYGGDVTQNKICGDISLSISVQYKDWGADYVCITGGDGWVLY